MAIQDHKLALTRGIYRFGSICNSIRPNYIELVFLRLYNIQVG